MKVLNGVCETWSNEVWEIDDEIHMVIDYNVSFKIVGDDVYDPITIEIIEIKTPIGAINLKTLRNTMAETLREYIKNKKAMTVVEHYMETKDIP